MARVTVEISAEWTSATSGVRQVRVQGDTVQECITRAVDEYPLLAERIAPDRHSTFLNWVAVRLIGGTSAPTADGDRIQMVPLRA